MAWPRCLEETQATEPRQEPRATASPVRGEARGPGPAAHRLSSSTSTSGHLPDQGRGLGGSQGPSRRSRPRSAAAAGASAKVRRLWKSSVARVIAVVVCRRRRRRRNSIARAAAAAANQAGATCTPSRPQPPLAPMTSRRVPTPTPLRLSACARASARERQRARARARPSAQDERYAGKCAVYRHRIAAVVPPHSDGTALAC